MAIKLIVVALLTVVGIITASEFDKQWEEAISKSKCKPINQTISDLRKHEIETCSEEVLGCSVDEADFIFLAYEASHNKTQITKIVECVAKKRGILTDNGIDIKKAVDSLDETDFETPQDKEDLLNARRDCCITNLYDTDKAFYCCYIVTLEICGLKDESEEENGDSIEGMAV